MIPEASGLIELGNFAESTRLKRKSQGWEICDSFRKEHCEHISSSGPPVMTDDGELTNSELIGEIDRILRESHTGTDTRGFVGQKPRWTRASKIR